ncbi:hypothetical protein HYY70_03095 [Candidatus Woesearchaeota archaeon]|nr:hypothetical protein [Candidatus Woesearchaeota archaeon]
MAFFRIKKIKGKEYTYIVENKWSKKGSRQKVKGYIGRIYKFNLVNSVNFFDFLKINDAQVYLENNNNNTIIHDLVEWELYKFGVNKNEFLIDLNEKKVQKKEKNISLLINEGFMCSITLKNLLEFKAEGDEQTDGYRFARAFVEAGIKVPQDVFISLFGKLYKTTE